MKYFVAVELTYEGIHICEFDTLEDAKREHDKAYSKSHMTRLEMLYR
ncbi:hypothetical protein LCGC14_3100660 [marine sediment metagenome]|uniref:AP2/ERF domain-containing protein n=1 Tax=marine sediment metagenome TaxID=412755 RepID=A0A0F8YY08_9ZZZZ